MPGVRLLDSVHRQGTNRVDAKAIDTWGGRSTGSHNRVHRHVSLDATFRTLVAHLRAGDTIHTGMVKRPCSTNMVMERMVPPRWRIVGEIRSTSGETCETLRPRALLPLDTQCHRGFAGTGRREPNHPQSPSRRRNVFSARPAAGNRRIRHIRFGT